MGYDLQVLQSNVDMLTEQGKYNEAIELLKKEADSICDENAVQGTILNELEGLCRAVDSYTESESAFKKAMEILSKFPGKMTLITRRRSIILPEHTVSQTNGTRPSLFL
jgi:tetratricopeptide (TPR) repeat protein